MCKLNLCTEVKCKFKLFIKKYTFRMKCSENDEEQTPMVALKTSDADHSSSSSTLKNENISGSFEQNSSVFRPRTYSRWSPIEQGVTLAWSDVYVYAKTKKNDSGRVYKRIVNGVTGAVKAGTLVAVMGASGAGKSTLMSSLAYRNVADMIVEGDILINGRPIGNYMKYLSGYMHQEDIFIGSLTILEHMNMMAKLKLDRRVSKTEIYRRIHEILNDLGLTNSLNTRIGYGDDNKALSGGEKKRLAFAAELLTDPPILFCDEPTTGLDAYSAQKLISMMNIMASSGKTILCTIHQPSSEIFNMFTQIILLADGRIAYMGSTACAIDFFDYLGYTCPDNYNPADFFVKTLAPTPGLENASKQTIKKICDYFAVSDYARIVDTVVQYEFHIWRVGELKEFTLRTNFKEIFWWNKLYCLTYRNFLNVLRNPAVHNLRILHKMSIAVMVGLCFLGTNPYTQAGIQSVQGAIFMIVTENTFNPMYAVLAEFPQDAPLFLREYKSGLYHPLIYYLSKILAMIPRLIVEPLCFVAIIYWLSGLLASTFAFFITALSAVLTMNVSTACGVLFSNAFDSVPTAMAYLVPFDYVLMVTSGLFVRLSTLPTVISWTRYLSWLMYSTETISIIQWTGVHNITCDTPNSDIPCITNGSAVLEKYSFSQDNLFRDLWSMLFLCISFYCLGYICLWWKTKKR